MLGSVRSATLLGVDGQVVSVEVHVSNGLPAYNVVGLPDAAGRESRERVRAALLSTGLEFPMRRITVNLAPATVRKTGSGLELAIALALLVADGNLPDVVLEGTGVIGELGLDGRVRPAAGVLALVDALAKVGVERVVVPDANATEAALVPQVEVLVARNLGELHACLKGEAPWPSPTPLPPPAITGSPDEPLDLADVRGLPTAREALVVSAAGGHHLLVAGPPGAGKTMLARRLPTILPPLEPDEALEVTRIHSAAGIAPLAAWSSTVRSGRHTTPRRARPWSAAAAHGRDRVRSPSLTEGSSSSTRSPSSRPSCSKRCANRWKNT